MYNKRAIIIFVASVAVLLSGAAVYSVYNNNATVPNVENPSTDIEDIGLPDVPDNVQVGEYGKYYGSESGTVFEDRSGYLSYMKPRIEILRDDVVYLRDSIYNSDIDDAQMKQTVEYIKYDSYQVINCRVTEDLKETYDVFHKFVIEAKQAAHLISLAMSAKEEGDLAEYETKLSEAYNILEEIDLKAIEIKI